MTAFISTNIHVATNTTIISVNDGVDFKDVKSSSVLFIDNQHPVIVDAGTSPINGVSTLQLRSAWQYPTIESGRALLLIGMNALADAISKTSQVGDLLNALTVAHADLFSSMQERYEIKINSVQTVHVPTYPYLVEQMQRNNAMQFNQFDAIRALNRKTHKSSQLSGDVSYASVASAFFLNDAVYNIDGIVVNAGSTAISMPSSPTATTVNANITVTTTQKHDYLIFGNDIYLCVDAAASGAMLTQSDKFKKVVAVSREDLVGLQVEVVELGVDGVDVVYPRGMIQQAQQNYVGMQLSNTLISQSYCAFGSWDTFTKGYGARWSSLTAEERAIWLSDNKNNIYQKDGKYYQAQAKYRVIKGVGNGWQVAPWHNDYLQFDADNYVSQSSDIDLDSNQSFTSTGKLYQSDSNVYFLPLHTVTRFNDGAHHPFFNSLGLSISNNKSWYDSDITSAADCFKSTSKGTLASGTSGHPAGFYHDVIYANQVQHILPPHVELSTLRALHKLMNGKMQCFSPLSAVVSFDSSTVTTSGGFSADDTYDGRIYVPISDHSSPANTKLYDGLSAIGFILSGDNGQRVTVHRDNTQIDSVNDNCSFPLGSTYAVINGINGYQRQVVDKLNAAFPPGTTLRIAAVIATNIKFSALPQIDVIASTDFLDSLGVDYLCGCNVLDKTPAGTLSTYTLTSPVKQAHGKYSSGGWTHDADVLQHIESQQIDLMLSSNSYSLLYYTSYALSLASTTQSALCAVPAIALIPLSDTVLSHHIIHTSTSLSGAMCNASLDAVYLDEHEMLLRDANYRPRHVPVSITSGVLKHIAYTSDGAGMQWLYVCSKQVRSVDADDNTFDVVDGVTATLDDNGDYVLTSCHKFTQPIGYAYES